MKTKKRPAKILWITDPWETLDHPNDTSLRLIEECLKLGVEAWWCDVKSVRFEDGACRLDARRVREIRPARCADDFTLDPARAATPGEFSRVVYRTDPPVDLAYLQPLQLIRLGLGPKTERTTELVNRLSVLMLSNEKLAGLGLLPPTIAATQWAPLEAFGRAHSRAVLKPLHEAQSHGVELLDFTTPDGLARAKEACARATDGHQRPALLQSYLPGIARGEQRLWFLNGKFLAAVRKLPKSGEFKIDMDRGGTLAATTLSAREKAVARKIGKLLRESRIRMAAVDLIDGYVTDFNFTSPGLLTPMEKVTGRNLARPVIRSLLKLWR